VRGHPHWGRLTAQPSFLPATPTQHPPTASSRSHRQRHRDRLGPQTHGRTCPRQASFPLVSDHNVSPFPSRMHLQNRPVPPILIHTQTKFPFTSPMLSADDPLASHTYNTVHRQRPIVKHHLTNPSRTVSQGLGDPSTRQALVPHCKYGQLGQHAHSSLAKMPTSRRLSEAAPRDIHQAWQSSAPAELPPSRRSILKPCWPDGPQSRFSRLRPIPSHLFP
jgi:hypothetical protein